MRHLNCIATVVASLLPCVLFAQTLEPAISRQIQFIWEKSEVPFKGEGKQVVDSVFKALAHEHGLFAVALQQRTGQLENHWDQLIPSASPNTHNLLTANSFIQPGQRSIVIPQSLVPEDWHDGDWYLISDGILHSCELDVPVSIEIPIGTEATSIGVRCEHGGTVHEAHVLLPVFGFESCVEPDLPPWPESNGLDPHWVGVFHEGIPVTGQALVKLGDDGIFDKPLVLIEGFDPDLQNNSPSYGYGDLNWEVLWNCEGNFNSALDALSPLLDSLLHENFDFVFLDFQNGTQSIAHQSALLEYVLDMCASYRIGYEPLVLIGPSMGGVVGRNTLRQMELQGTEHCTRLFIALDSPFRGAHLPVSLQEAIAFFSTISADAAALQDALLSPAAGELLVGSPFHAPSVRAELESFQLEHGLPTRSINLGIANGHADFTYAIPSLWYEANESFFGWDLVDIALWSQPGNASHPESNLSQWVIFEGSLLNDDWSWGEPLFYEGTAWQPISQPVLESLPGSYSNHLGQFQLALEQAGIAPDNGSTQSMFIPVHSALDLELEQSYDPDEVPFDLWEMEPYEVGSAFHCDISHHTQILLDAIVEGQPATASADNAIQLGWENHFARSLTQIDSSEVEVIEIGTTAANGTGIWPRFDARNTACAPSITLYDDQVMLIGDTLGSGRGSFNLLSNTTMILEGDLHIGPHSELILEENAVLHLQGGKICVHPFGKLTQLPDSKIETTSSSMVELNGATSQWEMAGDLIIQNSDTLTITARTAGNMGSWIWKGNSVYTSIQDNGLLLLKSVNGGFAEVQMQNQSGHLITGNGKSSWQNAVFSLGEEVDWAVHSRTDFENCHVLGTGANASMFVMNRLKWHYGTIENCQFSASNAGIAAIRLTDVAANQAEVHLDSIGVRLVDCTFENSSVHGHALAQNSSLQGTFFFGGIGENSQLQLDQNPHPVRLEDCEFTSNNKGIESSYTTMQLACNAWSHLDTAIHLLTGSRLVACLPWGQNEWVENGTHIVCEASWMPDFVGGGNRMGDAEDALFLGNIVNEFAVPTSNGPFLVQQNENSWPGSILGVPMIVPYTSLYLDSTTIEIIFKDASPNIGMCTSPTPTDASSQLKYSGSKLNSNANREFTVYPIPTTDALTIDWGYVGDQVWHEPCVRLLDMAGRVVFENYAISTSSSHWTFELGDLSNGIYQLEMRSNLELIGTTTVIIGH